MILNKQSNVLTSLFVAKVDVEVGEIVRFAETEFFADVAEPEIAANFTVWRSPSTVMSPIKTDS